MWFVSKRKYDQAVDMINQCEARYFDLQEQHRELTKAHQEQELELDRLRLQIQNVRQTNQHLHGQLELLRKKG